MLDAIAKLAQHRVGHVARILCDEVDADPLRANQAHHLLDLVQQDLRRIVEQQMRFVEKEYELRLVGVADLRQPLVELGQEPQQHRRIELRRAEEPIRCEDVDDAASPARLEQILDVQHRLADEAIGALLLERQQSALDCANRGGGYIAVTGRELLRVVADVAEQRAQIFQVEQQQTVVVGKFESERQHARLGVVELQNSGPQQRSEIAGRRANRVALLAENVPENGRKAGETRRLDADELQPLLELRRGHAGLAHTSQVTLDVRHEDRNADGREALGDDLQRDGLPGAGRAGDEAVAVGQCRQQAKLQFAVLGDDKRVRHRNIRGRD